MGRSKPTTFIDNWESQVRKGVLAYVVLLCLLEQEYYGYELISQVKTLTALDISEGTIYPLLNRLKKEGLVSARWVTMDVGVPRKYYRITEEGRLRLDQMTASWTTLNEAILRLRTWQST